MDHLSGVIKFRINQDFLIDTLVNVYVDLLVFTRIAGPFIDRKW